MHTSSRKLTTCRVARPFEISVHTVTVSYMPWWNHHTFEASVCTVAPDSPPVIFVGNCGGGHGLRRTSKFFVFCFWLRHLLHRSRRRLSVSSCFFPSAPHFGRFSTSSTVDIKRQTPRDAGSRRQQRHGSYASLLKLFKT